MNRVLVPVTDDSYLVQADILDAVDSRSLVMRRNWPGRPLIDSVYKSHKPRTQVQYLRIVLSGIGPTGFNPLLYVAHLFLLFNLIFIFKASWPVCSFVLFLIM